MAAITNYTTNKTQFCVAHFMYYANMQRITKKKVFQGNLFPNRNRKLAQKGPKYVSSIFDSLRIKDFWLHVHAHLVAHCKTIITILISLVFKEI